MDRREFVAALGGAAVTWPLAAQAQQAPMPMVGFLHSASVRNYELLVNAFREGLANAGYVEGRNVTIEYRWAESQLDRLPALATDLVRRRVSVIAACGIRRIGGQIGNWIDSNCVRDCGRPRADRTGCEPQPSWRQRHRVHQYQR
jgi:hypothetical protein